ncbi:unnamed protein product [Rotaria sp. Silwood2]|nr:unnamed protein product [Rotaria sp. Silwood2]
MVSYLMLAEYEKKTLPMIQLSYDGNATSKKNESEMNTYSQTQRCIQFAKHLGFEKCFLNPIKLPGSGFRSNPRQKKLLNYLKNNIISKGRVYFVEQKLLTTLISHYFIENGRNKATDILRESFQKWSVDEKVNNTIKNDVQDEIKRMDASKSLIIIQYRYSSKANKNENTDDIEIFKRLNNYLNEKNYNTWYLFVDSRSTEPSTIEHIHNKKHCFPYEIQNIDCGKLFHLEFLLQVSKLKNLQGIIGNTSGCLDLAAFVGHNVLNFHQFNNKMNYQSYRIFLQSSFLIVEDFNVDIIKNSLKDKTGRLNDLNDEIMKTRMPIADKWINKESTSTFPEGKVSNTPDARIHNAGFADLHHIISWENADKHEKSIPVFQKVVRKLCNNIQ